MLSGDNSILQKTKDAKTNTDNAQINERVQLAYTAAMADGNGELTEPNLRTELTNEFGASYTLTEDTTENKWIISVNEIERLRVDKETNNTIEKDDWILAWTYSEENGWSDDILATQEQSLNGDIIAKIYPKKNSTDIENEYILNITGSGELGALASNDKNKNLKIASINGINNLKLAGFAPSFKAWQGTNAISINNITEVKINYGVSNIPYMAFKNFSNLKKIEIPNSVLAIENSAFESSGIEKIIIPNSVREIGVKCFMYCASLKEAKLSNNLTAIPDYCFDHCNNLNDIVIPNNVIKIGTYAFSNCEVLNSITYSKANIYSEGSAFNDCNSIKEVNFLGTKQEYASATGPGTLYTQLGHTGVKIICTDGEIQY